jgi:hypothetical protein
MDSAGILIIGVLALVAVLVVSAILVATAPYLAAALIVSLVFWWVSRRDQPPGGPTAPTKLDPRE